MQIKRHTLRRVLLVLLIAGAMVGLYLLGRAVTPATGDPVLYAPAVHRTETYRRQAQGWLEQFGVLDADLLLALTDSQADLYTQSQRAQTNEEQALGLAQQISLVYPPPALVGLHQALTATANAYGAATQTVNQWIGAPTATQYLAALEALRLARAVHAETAANPWLVVTPSPTGAIYAEPTSENEPTSERPAAGWGE